MSGLPWYFQAAFVAAVVACLALTVALLLALLGGTVLAVRWLS